MQNDSYFKGLVQDFQRYLKQIGIRWHVCMDEQVIAPLCFRVTSLPNPWQSLSACDMCQADGTIQLLLA